MLLQSFSSSRFKTLFHFAEQSFLLSLVEGLSLLGAYEDSDEEDAGDSHRSAANSQHNQSGDIDSTLANFMAVSMMRIL